MKFITLALISILITFSAFSQEPTDKQKTITTGVPVYLEFVDATITPPAGYLFLNDYSSFLNQKNQTSISVVKENGMPYQSFVDNMLNKDYTIGNAKLLSSAPLKDGYLFTFLFEINNQPVERIVYVVGDKSSCLWASANYKQVEKELHYETLKNTLLSINL